MSRSKCIRLTCCEPNHSRLDPDRFLAGDDFQNETESFMQTHCVIFERSEEMKLEYTTLFQQYVSAVPPPRLCFQLESGWADRLFPLSQTSIIENHLMRGLKEAFPELEMDQLLALLE